MANKNYRIYGNITRSRLEKDIGVTIDDQLSFSEHMAEKINRVFVIFGLIKGVFVHLEQGTIKLLFTSLVKPYLEYANQV